MVSHCNVVEGANDGKYQLQVSHITPTVLTNGAAQAGQLDASGTALYQMNGTGAEISFASTLPISPVL